MRQGVLKYYRNKKFRKMSIEVKDLRKLWSFGCFRSDTN